MSLWVRLGREILLQVCLKWTYDARARFALRRLAHALNVRWATLAR
jgi:hypothetical protein